MTIRQILNNNKDYILSSLKNGVSTTILAKEFNCNSGSIYLFAKEYNTYSKNKRSEIYGHINDYKDEIISLYNDGKSAYFISKQVNISKITILKKLKEWGLDTSRYNKINKNKPLLKTREKEVIDLYQQGYSQAQIGPAPNSVILSTNSFLAI